MCSCSLFQDLRRCGCSLATILAAGQWKSAAFLSYIDEAELAKDLAFQVATLSDEEEWIDRNEDEAPNLEIAMGDSPVLAD